MNWQEYFLNYHKDGFERFFKECKKKYYSYGKVTGIIKLNDITSLEATAFKDLLGTSFHEHDNIKISIKKFYERLKGTTIEDFNFLDLFIKTDSNFNGHSKKETKELEEQEYQAYLQKSITNINNESLKQIILDDNQDFDKIIRKYYKESRSKLSQILSNLDILLNNLPTKITYLPIYASLTSNPHYLDINSKSSNDFLKILCIINHLKYPNTLQEKIDIFNSINVYTDPLSNYILTSNLVISKSINKFYNQYGSLILNLENLENMKSITGKNNIIFMFENPSVLNYFKSLNKDYSIVIVSGMPNMACYKLLDNIDDNCNIYYHGDYDPEGLLIAQKLKMRYPKIKLLGYSKDNYFKSYPNNIISSISLSKLNNIVVPELKEIKESIITKRKAGYEENMLKLLNEYVEKIYNQKA